MPYLNFDDQYPEHRKIECLSHGAYRLHSSATFYAGRSLTDGGITIEKLRRIMPNYKAAYLKELLDADLIHEPMNACETDTCKNCGPDEYVIHDYLQWNKSRAWWEKKRADDAERQANWRAEHAKKEAS